MLRQTLRERVIRVVDPPWRVNPHWNVFPAVLHIHQAVWATRVRTDPVQHSPQHTHQLQLRTLPLNKGTLCEEILPDSTTCTFSFLNILLLKREHGDNQGLAQFAIYFQQLLNTFQVLIQVILVMVFQVYQKFKVNFIKKK
jgi:hypothetical protein